MTKMDISPTLRLSSQRIVSSAGTVAAAVASEVDSRCTCPVSVESIRCAVVVAVASKNDMASLATRESIHGTVAVAAKIDSCDDQ